MEIKPNQNPMYVRKFNNENDLLNAIEKDDPAVAKTKKYLYRGQLARIEKPWPEILHDSYPSEYYKIDSIIPTDTRLLSKRIAKGHINQNDFQFQYGTLLSQVRSTSTFVVIQKRITELADDEVNRWINAQKDRPVGHKFDKLGSIGQHYNVKTTYLDVTTNPYVALFFATYDFQTNSYAGEGQRIIYRIKKDKLLKAQNRINKQNSFTGMDMHRAVDLADTPEQLAPRAIRQEGWSIINFELTDLLEELIDKGGITAFCFNSSSHQHNRNCRTIDDIIPPNDRLADLFNTYAVDGQTEDELQAWLNKFVNPNRSEQDRVRLQDKNWVTHFFKPYDWI